MKKKFGEWILDVAKYLVTVCLATPLFSNMGEWPVLAVISVVLFVMLLVWCGLVMACAETKSNTANELKLVRKETKKRK